MRVSSLQFSRWQLTTSTPQAEAAFIRGNQVISKPACLNYGRRVHLSHFHLNVFAVIALFSACPFLYSVSLSQSNFSPDLACCARLLAGEKRVEERFDPCPEHPTFYFLHLRKKVLREEKIRSSNGFQAKSAIQLTESHKAFLS
jgi:hypothetical protein